MIGAVLPEPIPVLGVNVVPFDSYDHAVQCVEEVVRSRGRSFWVAINPQKAYRAWHDVALRSILNQADAGTCDGIGVSIAVAMLHRRTIQRCTGLPTDRTDLATPRRARTESVGKNGECGSSAWR